MAQQEGKQLLTLAAEIVGGSFPRANEIADGFVSRIRYPNPGELTSPMQPRKRDRVSPVGLDPLTRALRDQSWRNDHAVMTESLDLAIQPVPNRAGLKADMQPTIAARQLLDDLLDPRRRVLDISKKSDLASAAAFGDRNRMLRFGNVKRHKGFAILSHSPCVRFGSARPSNPRSIAR